MFTSDHGERAGAHGMRQKAGTIYREETNVPMIIVHPDIVGGQSTKGLMSAVDIAPTLMSLAGLDQEEQRKLFPNLPGIDVSSLLENPAGKTRRDIRGHFFNYAVAHMWEPKPKTAAGPRAPSDATPDYNVIYDLSKRRLHRGVHDGRWKFARYFAPAQHHMPTNWKELSGNNDLELYDTSNDLSELVNLAYLPEHRETVMRLNGMVNRLSIEEIGKGLDDGREYPGSTAIYNQPLS